VTEISIVIPTYGRPGPLRKCLEGVTDLDYPAGRFEVIVVDDGSPEPVAPSLESFSGCLDLTAIRQLNRGPAAARNTGASRAAGRWLAFTDDDCVPDRDWLAALADRLRVVDSRTAIGGRTRSGHPGEKDRPVYTWEDLATCAAGEDVVALTGCWQGAVPRAATAGDLDRAVAEASRLLERSRREQSLAGTGELAFLPTSNLAVSREAFHAVGGFDERFRNYEDMEFCHRWRQEGGRLVAEPAAIVHHFRPTGLTAFWRQHTGYGRGAAAFYAADRFPLRDRIGRLPDLYARALRGARTTPRPAAVTALILVSQLAALAGFGLGRLRSRAPAGESAA